MRVSFDAHSDRVGRFLVGLQDEGAVAFAGEGAGERADVDLIHTRILGEGGGAAHCVEQAGLLEQRGVVIGSGQLPWVGPALGAAAGLVGVALYGLVGWLLGQDGFAEIDYLLLTPLELVVAASLMMPTVWAMRWALA